VLLRVLLRATVSEGVGGAREGFMGADGRGEEA